MAGTWEKKRTQEPSEEARRQGGRVKPRAGRGQKQGLGSEGREGRGGLSTCRIGGAVGAERREHLGRKG